MNGGAIAGLATAAIATLVALLAFITSARANRDQAATAAKAVDAEAYERARQIYESGLHALELQVTQLQGRIDQMSAQDVIREETIRDLRAQLTEVQATREQEIRDLRNQLTLKESMIQTLQARLANGKDGPEGF